MNDSTWAYDAIADVYATDMGSSMPFDDVGFYRRCCVRAKGRVLELGCGTGRILLDLLAHGIDAFGVDRSLPMLRRLRQDAAARGIASPRVAQMDILALAVHGEFDAILAPYSLITYVTDPRVATDMLRGLRGVLTRSGVLVLDAFVPQPVTAFAEFRPDYCRPHEGGTLERAKRIATRSDGTNHIERRYRVLNAHGALLREFVTAETIRPYAAQMLAGVATDAGFAIRERTYDYGATQEGGAARFLTLTLSR